MPEQGRDIAPVIDEFSETCFRLSTHNGSPRLFGFITSFVAPIGALADMLAAAVNPNCGAWALSPVATEIENGQSVGCRSSWVCPAMGRRDRERRQHGEHGWVYRGKNLKAGWDIPTTGLTEGEECESSRPLHVEEAHTWVNKAADIGGLGTDAVLWIPTDDELRMRVTCSRNRSPPIWRRG